MGVVYKRMCAQTTVQEEDLGRVVKLQLILKTVLYIAVKQCEDDAGIFSK